MAKRNALFASLLVIALAVSGCFFGGPGELAAVEISGATTVKQGGSVTLTVKGVDDKGKEVSVSDPKWALDDQSKGTLTPDGTKATFKAAEDAVGKVKVTVTVSDFSDSVEIQITEASDDPGDDPGQDPGDDDEPADPNVILIENFAAADADEFFSAEYKHLPGQSDKPLYFATAGRERISIEDGVLTMTNARFTIGMPADHPSTEEGGQPEGALDLSKPWRLTFEVVDVYQNPDQSDDGKRSFFVYIDNNTTSQKNSIHGDENRIVKTFEELQPNSIMIVESMLGTQNSFLQIRAESGLGIKIKSMKLEYK